MTEVSLIYTLKLSPYTSWNTPMSSQHMHQYVPCNEISRLHMNVAKQNSL